MDNSNPTEKELIARTDSRHRIGTDADGGAHYFCRVRGVVWVVSENGEVKIEHVEQTRNLGKWRRFVADRRGWVEHSIDDRTDAEFVADAARRLLEEVA